MKVPSSLLQLVRIKRFGQHIHHTMTIVLNAQFVNEAHQHGLMLADKPHLKQMVGNCFRRLP